MTSEQYAAAALRHYNDAVLLFQHRRFENSGYLAGYVTECTLKFVIALADLEVRRFAHDLSKLTCDAWQLAAVLEPSLTRYSPSEEDAGQRLLVQKWRPDLRYRDNGCLNESDTTAFLSGARVVVERVLAELVLDGKVALQ